MYIVLFIDIYLVVLNANHWDLRRWSIDKLRDELNRRNIHFDTILERDKLMNLLNQEMGEDS